MLSPTQDSKDDFIAIHRHFGSSFMTCGLASAGRPLEEKGGRWREKDGWREGVGRGKGGKRSEREGRGKG